MTEAAILAGERITSLRAAGWIWSLHRYEQFWHEHARAPRENTRARETLGPDERHLGEWARYQRRFHDRLNAYQLARLDASPAFEWDPRAADWQRNFDAARLHIHRNGDLPRLNPDDAAEFALARWLARQLRLLQIGALAPGRVELLHQLLRRASGRSDLR